MASISRDPGGRRRILFVAPDKKRKSIRLGKVSQRAAEAVKVKVEDLVASAITGHAPSDETARWVAGLEDALAEKLSRAGLIPKRGTANLDSFIRAYIEARKADLKPRTLMKLHTTHQAMVKFFGASRNLRDITPGGDCKCCGKGW
jgi:hypothetical protein